MSASTNNIVHVIVIEGRTGMIVEQLDKKQRGRVARAMRHDYIDTGAFTAEITYQSWLPLAEVRDAALSYLDGRYGRPF